MNDIHIDVPPDRVFEVLASGQTYADWVVGAKEVRAVDDRWPQPGSKIHHTVGLGPFEVADNTEVIELDAPRRILLEARVRPFGRAHVELAVEAEGGGTRVRMSEKVVRVPSIVNCLLGPAIRSRNAESLRRLRSLCDKGA